MAGELVGSIKYTLILFVCTAACTARQPAAQAPITTQVQAGMTPWRPPQTASWQIQLSGELDTHLEASVFDLDGFDTDAELAASLRGQGRHLICYINAGAWEDWRPDRGQFPKIVIGKDYIGWKGEKWLDIRRLDLLEPILRARIELCQQKGFEAIEFDNVDGYTNDTGFRLTAQDQLAFNTWLASAAHQNGMAAGLKNDPEQAAELAPDFDFAIVEDCFAEGWCAQFQPFLEAGKAVFAIEYTDRVRNLKPFCEQARAMKINLLLKHRRLDRYRETCDGE